MLHGCRGRAFVQTSNSLFLDQKLQRVSGASEPLGNFRMVNSAFMLTGSIAGMAAETVKTGLEKEFHVTYKAVFNLSVGVTARTLSTVPAAFPAMIPRPEDSFPSESANTFLIASKVINRTLALKAVPTTSVEHPVYMAPNPSVLTIV